MERQEFCLYMGTFGREFKKKKKQTAVHVGGGESLGLLNVYRTSVWGDEKVPEIDSGGGYTTP